MNKSKYSVLSTYLLIAAFALVAVGNHFGLIENSASDILPSSANIFSTPRIFETPTPVEADLADTFAPAALAENTVPSAPVTSAPKITRLPAATRVGSTSVDAGTGIKIYRQMLYAHSTLAGSSFKSLQIGSLISVAVDGVQGTYEIVSREVHPVDVFNRDDILKSQVYNYSQGLSLMTCGNGSNDDSAYRLILFAKKVA